MRLLALAALLSVPVTAAVSQQSTTPATQTSPAPASSPTPTDTTTSQAPSAAPADSTTTPTISTDPTKPTSTDKPSTDKPDKSKKTDTAATDKPDVMPNPGEALDPNIKKGSEEDVNAVGTRNIGGRGMGNWYSPNWEVGTGKQYSMEVEKSSHLVTDPVVVEYINRVGQNLVKNSDAKFPFTIKVLDTDEINAMEIGRAHV